jgi:putative membrane protein
MHTGTHYHLKEFLAWTRRDIYVVLIISAIPTILYEVLGFRWLAIPWLPISLTGTGAAFILGFRSSQIYNRLWEARQAWGTITATSRTWGVMVTNFVHSDTRIHQQLIYRHFAWLTALRFQLRKKQPWETMSKSHNQEYSKLYSVPEWDMNIEDELKKYITDEEQHYTLGKMNRATQLIALQSRQLSILRASGALGDSAYMEMQKRLAELGEQQARCERIKDFPYPRQFASITIFFVWLFVFLLPFGMLNEFQKLGEYFVWLTIPFTVIVSWVFIALDRVGEAAENPFEGSSNDIPMAALSRSIEIDLREMLDEDKLPLPLNPMNNILM